MVSMRSEPTQNQPEPRTDPITEQRRILDAAISALVAHRHGDPGVHDILRLAGVSGRTLYSHFPSKDDLYVALVHRTFDEVLARLQAKTAGSADPLSQIDACIEGYLDRYFVEDQREAIARVLTGAVARAAGFGQAVADGCSRLDAVLAEALTRAQQANLVTSAEPQRDATTIRVILDSVCDPLVTNNPAASRDAAVGYMKRFCWPALGLAA